MLSRCLMSVRFSLTTVALIGLECLDALQRMHRLGFIHRDIKPVCTNVSIRITIIKLH